MVYRGKPSMGCRTCRARRIRCDETKPVCNQCIKSRRHCSGYRSDFDILHRDETKATEQRARKAAAKKAAKKALDDDRSLRSPSKSSSNGTLVEGGHGPEPGAAALTTVVKRRRSSTKSRFRGSDDEEDDDDEEDWDDDDYDTSSTVSPMTDISPHEIVFSVRPMPLPAAPIEDQASNFFAANFIVLPTQMRYGGHLSYLLPLLKRDPKPSSPIQLAYSACALAAMGNRRRSNKVNLQEMALLQHARALAATHHALKDPERCRSDSTLATVILLSMFEKISATPETGLLAWRSHVEGAANIVRSRGKDQLKGKDKVTLHLFNAVRISVIARNLSTGTSSAMGVDWWLEDSIDFDSAGAQCQRFSLRYSELAVKSSKLIATLPRDMASMEIMYATLREAQELDSETVAFLSNLPEQLQYKCLYWEESVIPHEEVCNAKAFPGRVDIYPDFTIAAMWNATRSTRMLLNSLIIRIAAWLCSPADFRATPECMTAKRICEEMIADIISSIPYHLGPPDSKRGIFQNANAAGFACGLDTQSRALGGLSCSWNMATCATSDYTTDAQRAYVIGRLKWISYELGIRYCDTLADCKLRFPSMIMKYGGVPKGNNVMARLQQMLPVR